MSEKYWFAVRGVRLGIAQQLESLDAHEWDAPRCARAGVSVTWQDPRRAQRALRRHRAQPGHRPSLGREFSVPAELARDALDRVWGMGWPFKARRRLAGHALTANDVEWTVGTGPEIRGSALTLLLLLTGRTSTALPSLTGSGVEDLSA